MAFSQPRFGMALEEPYRLVQFLTTWVTSSPWKHDGAIAGNEHRLCASIFPDPGTTPAECDPLWKRVFSMHLSDIAGSGRYKRRSTSRGTTGARWETCATQSPLATALRTGKKWNWLGDRHGKGIAMLVRLPEGFMESHSKERWKTAGESLDDAVLPGMTLLSDMYKLAVENRQLPVAMYKQLMTWLLPVSPSEECVSLHRLSLELLIRRLPDDGRKWLYQLVLGSRQERIDHRTRIAALLEGSHGEARAALHTFVMNDKALEEPAFAKMAAHLIHESPDKERETLLKLALNGERLVVGHYEDMITWLAQENTLTRDPMDLTTVSNFTVFLWRLGVLPEHEGTWLYQRVLEKRPPTVEHYRTLILRILQPFQTTVLYDLRGIMANHTRPVTEYKQICIWLLDHLPNNHINSIYRVMVQGSAVPAHLVDFLTACLLGVTIDTPRTLDYIIPDSVFTKLVYTLEHGLPVVPALPPDTIPTTVGERIAAETATGSDWDFELDLLDEYLECNAPAPTAITDDRVNGASVYRRQEDDEVVRVWPTLDF